MVWTLLVEDSMPAAVVIEEESVLFGLSWIDTDGTGIP